MSRGGRSRPALADKTCRVCGRRFEWRRKWQDCWDEVRHCSQACRKRGLSDLDRKIESEVVGLLSQRSRGASICPSEVARALWPEEWRPRMEEVRMAGRRLTAAGQLQILQRGKVVDPSTAKGPVRFRLGSAAPVRVR